ncbi:amidase [Psychromonas sp. 14N.309.X.WAT.B.A12]|uniref:amidase n=1 Tax=Psychromonas sp. 14N.309.X.WAT.B.A12 TaxID=2998322 RepID=UPI0025B086A7|nr:amidase [Psychromonas sp. 14N.309.X.WAT.B.A12]MDN2663447.1 amidase [Psychromonas sp. 14N.309.X.WAT.B.A12]
MSNNTTKDNSVYCLQGPEKLSATGSGLLNNKSFVFKDLFDVTGFVTGAGNPAWLNSHEPANKTSPLIDKLLSQGANCVGRVQTDELAYSLNGQNIHYGTPTNPIAPNCLPGGSSSGSAVAVARKDVDFSIGTDTGGSVRVPASYCGLFGLRPTLGKLDLSNAFTLSTSFDTAGIFSRDLTLLKAVFKTLSEDNTSGKATAQIYLDDTLAKSLSETRLNSLQAWCKASSIKLLGCNLLGELAMTLDDLSLLFRTIQGYEIIQEHDQWLAKYGETLDPSILLRVDWARTITSAKYDQAKTQQRDFTNKVTDHLEQLNGLFVLPTTPSGAPSLTLTGEKLADYRSQLMGLTSIAGLSGLPQLHLPMADLDEGPCGFSLMGLANSEADLIATGLALTEEEVN